MAKKSKEEKYVMPDWLIRDTEEHKKELEKFIPTSKNYDPKDRIARALALAYRYGQIDGSHHRVWVIDNMVRLLTEEHYPEMIKLYKDGDGPESYTWDEGIAP